MMLSINFISYSQYSNYYNVDVNSNIKSNINIKQEVDLQQTVRKIDYGAMAQAEAQKEKIRLESKIYNDANQKKYAIEIANDPLKAFEYGEKIFWRAGRMFGTYKITETYGFKQLSVNHQRPNASLFVKKGNNNYAYINESLNGITTELDLSMVKSILTTKEILDLNKKEFKLKQDYWIPYFGEAEKYLIDNNDLLTGIKFPNSSKEYYLHKSEIKKAIVWGYDGFVLSVFKETKYERIVEEKYIAITSNGLMATSFVNYRGDKEKIDFGDLEARRAYLGPLTKKIISTAGIQDIKIND